MYIQQESNVLVTDGKTIILNNDHGQRKSDDGERGKRFATARIKASLDKFKSSLEKTLNDKESSILGSIRNSSILAKSKLPSLLDTVRLSIESGLAKGINLSPLQSTQQTKTPAAIPNAGKKVAIASAPTAKLSSLLKADEQSVGDAHRPIVLPDYLQDKDAAKHTQFSHGQITAKQLKEAADLRNQIKYAVKHNIYVHSASEVKNMNRKPAVNDDPTDPEYFPQEEIITTTTPAPVQPYQNQPFEVFFSNFWNNLIGRKKPKKISKFVGEPSLGSARSDFSYVPEPSQSPDEKIINPVPHEDEFEMENVNDGDDQEAIVQKMMAKAAEQMMSHGIVSNTVESYVNSVDVPNIETSQVREELNMTSITEDTRFNIGENVIGWRTLQRNKRESHALIGMTNSSIVLVLEKNNTYKLEVDMPLLSRPTFFTVFTFWNKTQRSIDGIVIVSIQHEIIFFRINEAMDKMQMIWMWPMHSLIKYVNHFVIDNSDTLLVITDLHNGSAANLYRFDMNERVFFLRESLALKTPAKNMALIQNGYDTFICFPQVGHVVIYKYVKQHFKYFTKIESQNADILSAFEMGGYTYLTIGGNDAKILRYHHGNFVEQTILSKSWGYVEFFLPVSARTFRDDLILFVQHRMDYGSHTNSYLEALIWNGHAFHPALQVPCYINDRESEFGLGCMLDEDRELGIIGATMFQRNRTISILVPRHEAPSGLFDLEIDLLPAVSNMNEHLLELLSEVIILMETQDEVLKNAHEIIDKFPKDPMDEVTIRNRDLDVVYTQDLDMGSAVPTEGVFINDELVTKKIVDGFLQLLNETETNVKTYEQLMRPKRADRDEIESLHLDSLTVDNLLVEYINDILADDLIFVEDGSLTLDGTAVISQSIEPEHVEWLVDDMDHLGQEVADTTIITGDLTFDEINGIKWKDFINQIVLKHLPNSLDDMDVQGVSFSFFFFLLSSSRRANIRYLFSLNRFRM